MKARGFWNLTLVSDVELVGSLKDLVTRSSWTEARIVAHLAELESRRLHLLAGRSLFRYCQECLGLSENEAYYRISAARMAQRFPIVFEFLENRAVHLTALALIRDYITTENHQQLLAAVAGKTKEQILVLLATRAPRPDAKNRIRKLTIRAGTVAAGPTGTLEPLSAEGYRLELHVSALLKQKLELAAYLMSHANPARDLAVVVERALDSLIEKLQQQRFAQFRRHRVTSEPNVSSGMGMGMGAGADADEREARVTARSDARAKTDAGTAGAADARKEASAGRPRAAIRNGIKRQLLERDGLGCSYISSDGHRCGARAFLQVHHEHAWARGGSDTLQNLRLVCHAHNALLAEQEFGAEHVAMRRRTG